MIQALLDSNALIWMLSDPGRITSRAAEIIQDGRNELFVSVASIGEIGIKHQTGKLTLKLPLERIVESELPGRRISILSISVRETLLAPRLPMHHRDPFDRLLLAQAQIGKLSIVSSDELLDAYGITRIW